MNGKLHIVLADDHALVRAGLASLLADIPDVEVVGEAGDGYEALELIEARRPDVALVDVSMPKMNGLELAMRVRKSHPNTRVMMLSMYDDEEFVRQALVAGASGYLLKQADRAELELALRAIVRGDTWLSPAVSKKLAADYTHGGKARTETPFERLTARQREVLQLIAEGQSGKEIAATLSLSPKTVEAHRAELMERLGIHGVAGLVRYAIRVGLVRPDA